jgi:hypothetical protein
LIRFAIGDLVVVGEFGPVDVYTGIPTPVLDQSMPKIVTRMREKQIGVVVQVINDKYVILTVNGTIGIVLSGILEKL